MPSNYAAIATQNRDDYGRRVTEYGKVLLQLLYSDRTHFIFELLQNAEDAGARQISFRLYRDRLEVDHTGRPFNEADVRAICGIVAGTKADDLTTIGRFGIGFKSVYAYTATPEIHSEDEHFRVRDYVYPEAIPAVAIPQNETRLIFPFNHHEVAPEQAFREIGRRLQDLGARPLLFLRHVREITWSIEGGARGTYLRDEASDGAARRIELIGDSTSDTDGIDERWLIFSRGVKGNPALKVEAGFKLEQDEKTGLDVIVPETTAQLIVFFPTEKETHLGFLIQGPYRTTPARDNVPSDDDWNRDLVDATAKLIVDTLPQLKKRGLLTTAAIETLPIREDLFPEDSMFAPIFDEVLDAFRTHRLLPSHAGQFVASDEAVLTNSATIRDLLDETQVQSLMGADQPLSWLSGDITRARTPDLWDYLTHQLDVPDIDSERIARHLTEAFMQSQSDEWMTLLYAFLLTQSSIWNRVAIAKQRGALGDKPIIRLEAGRHVPAFTKHGTPNAFISDEATSHFPIVRRTISADPDARRFLEAIGLTEPDVIDDLLVRVLPKYTPGRSKHITDDEHKRDIDLIFRTLQRIPHGRGVQLRTQLRTTPFLYGMNGDADKPEFVTPEQLYFRTPELETYFFGNRSVLFADDRYAPYRDELHELGVTGSVRVWRSAQPDQQGNVLYRGDSSPYARGLSYFDPEIEIDGLRHALQTPLLERSRYLWNQILPTYHRQMSGEIEECTRRNFTNADRKPMVSKIGRLLSSVAWLPNAGGELHTPDELTLDDLPPDFSRNDQLASALKMRLSTHAEHARELGVSLDDIDLIKRNRDEFESWKQSVASANTNDDDSGGVDEDMASIDFVAGLREVFQRSGRPMSDDDEVSFPAGEVPNPEFRRERVAAEIAAEQKLEPRKAERFKRVAKAQWEKRDNRARDFLRQEYEGRCQICNDTFLKRNGSPYFEGMYLNSRTSARWLDREGNVLCLCANCCSKLMYGPVEAGDIVEQINGLKLRREGGRRELAVDITLCGELAQIHFSERHLLDLQALLTASVDDDA